MKKAFPGHFELTKTQIDKLWKDGIFVFDANILLNLYRYSTEAKEDFFNILNEIKDRSWIPHQVALEYFNNRLNEVAKHEKKYDDMITNIQQIEEIFKSTKQHPFLNKRLLKKICDDFVKVKEDLEKNKDICYKIVKKDPIKNKITRLFSNKVGPEYNKEQLTDIFNEGKKRYDLKIPPGFKDTEKEPDQRKYGDLIIWKQIIDKSKDTKKGIIFITDDRKEDWWLIYNYKDEIVSPHPDLISEFKKETGKNLYIYRADRFIESASKILKKDINKDTISEIRLVRKSDEEEREKWAKLPEKERIMKWRLEKYNKLRTLEMKLRYLEDKRHSLLYESSRIKKKKFKDNILEDDILKLEGVQLKLENINDEIDILKKEINYLKHDFSFKNEYY